MSTSTRSSSKIIYTSFDRFPSSKGAAVHIGQFTAALADAFGDVDLVTVPTNTVGDPTIIGNSAPQTTSYRHNIRHTAIPAIGKSVVQRALSFRRGLEDWWQKTARQNLGQQKAHVVHFRSIFEGYWIAKNKSHVCDHLVYEVNGLPSIELKYHYPDIADDVELLHKLQMQEQACLAAADVIVTVSQVNADCLVRRGADPTKIHIIPNGVNPELFTYRSPSRWDGTNPEGREIKLLYAGTMSAWQGVTQALEALALYRRDYPARLILSGEVRNRQEKQILKACDRFGVLPYVEFRGPLSQQELAQLHHDCDVVLAPLTANDRNLVQGCCPLKVLEAMASGTPLVASDIPVVSALARSGTDAVLVKPGSAKAIKDGILRLKENPHLAASVSASARRRIKQQFTWAHARQSLVSLYEEQFGKKVVKKDRNASASPAG